MADRIYWPRQQLVRASSVCLCACVHADVCAPILKRGRSGNEPVFDNPPSPHPPSLMPVGGGRLQSVGSSLVRVTRVHTIPLGSAELHIGQSLSDTRGWAGQQLLVATQTRLSGKAN